jgi:hypothetical protein
MLEAHAPTSFTQLQMQPLLDRACTALAGTSLHLPSGLNADAAQARIDAAYVLHQRAGVSCGLQAEELKALLRSLAESGDTLHAWVLGEMAAQMGIDRRVIVEARWFQGRSQVHDLYWCTHRVLLASRFLHVALRHKDWSSELDTCVLAGPWIEETENIDLAGEVLFCIQHCAAEPSGLYGRLLEWLVSCQRADGSFGAPDPSPFARAHTTAAALLALAGEIERG